MSLFELYEVIRVRYKGLEKITEVYMDVQLITLSGVELNIALNIPYVSDEEENLFVIGAVDSFKEFPNYIHWIQCKETSGIWVDCGMISYGVEEGEFPGFWIQRLMIHPDFRKKKIATQALKLALKEAPPNIPIYVSTIITNIKMRSLLEKLGFIDIQAKDWGEEVVYKLERK